MTHEPKALLVVGPAGSGKSTLAESIADRPGWIAVSEDEYWVKHGWGSGMRSPEQERIVQEQVASDVLAANRAGQNVALEFILYKEPPNPLTAYQEVLSDSGIAYEVIALKPTVTEILRRMKQRGRPSDVADLEGRRRDAESQVAILESDHIHPEWVVDPTGRAVDDLCQECLAKLHARDP